MAWKNYNPYNKSRFSKNKYKNNKVEIDGIVFDSQREAKRYRELSIMLKAGEISDLQMQVTYELIPHQKDPVTGKVIERACTYIADFVYKDQNGKTVVEDTKGFRTEAYVIKRKLMLHVYGIKISEV